MMKLKPLLLAQAGPPDRWYNVDNLWFIAGLLGAVFYGFTRGY